MSAWIPRWRGRTSMRPGPVKRGSACRAARRRADQASRSRAGPLPRRPVDQDPPEPRTAPEAAVDRDHRGAARGQPAVRAGACQASPFPGWGRARHRRGPPLAALTEAADVDARQPESRAARIAKTRWRARNAGRRSRSARESGAPAGATVHGGQVPARTGPRAVTSGAATYPLSRCTSRRLREKC
jgi:hypothetical protein